MDQIEKRERYNKLLSIYGSLVSELERKDLIDYYSNDLSLSEIALNRNVSRNAIFSSIHQGENELNKMEEKMHILSSSLTLISDIEKLKQEDDIDKIKDGLDKISEVLKNGI